MLGNVNFQLVPNRPPPSVSEGLYQGFEDDDEHDEWASGDGSDALANEPDQEGAEGGGGEQEGQGEGTDDEVILNETINVSEPVAPVVGEEDGDDVDDQDAMDVTEDAEPTSQPPAT